jgi:hypothetical protein
MLLRLLGRKRTLQKSTSDRRRQEADGNRHILKESTSHQSLLSSRSESGARLDRQLSAANPRQQHEPAAWRQLQQQDRPSPASQLRYAAGSGRKAAVRRTTSFSKQQRAGAVLLRRRTGSQAGSRDGSTPTAGRLLSEEVEVHLVIGDSKDDGKGAEEQQAASQAAKIWSKEAEEVCAVGRRGGAGGRGAGRRPACC